MSLNIVAKYGGTSMAYPEIVARIIESNPGQKIIVCSAPGTSKKYPKKLTDVLIELIEKKQLNQDYSENIEYILRRFNDVVKDLDQNFIDEVLDNLKTDLEENIDTNFLVSRGEYYSGIALAHRINAKFIDAKELFAFNEDGKFDRNKSKNNINQKIIKEEKIVVPGFYGVKENGEICLFGRGGSDRSGAIIAASLNYTYENWTDVDGIMDADPTIITNTKVLNEITYEETREGAHGGTKVLMGDSVLDLEYGNSETFIKNTFNPEAPGTKVSKYRDAKKTKDVVAISARDDLIGLTIHDLGMKDTKGYLAKVMKLLAKNRISIEHMPAAQDSITITFHNKPSLNINEIKKSAEEITVSPSAQCSINECGVVYLVGEPLREIKIQHGVIISAMQALEDKEIGVLAIMMHAGSPSIAIILERNDTINAQKILYDKLVNN